METVKRGIELFQAGGPIMYILLLCSVAVMTIGIERLLYFKAVRGQEKQFSAEFSSLLGKGDLQAALGLCQSRKCLTAEVAASGLTCIKENISNIETVLEGEMSVRVDRLRENLNYLDTMVTIAPLLGLLGTVIGMIQSFSVFNVKAGQPTAITGGVGEALVATATGLCVAITAMVFYSYFKHKINQTITAMEEIAVVLLRQRKQADK